MHLLMLTTSKVFAVLLLWQDGSNVLGRVWSYIERPFTFGKITVSLAALAQGVVVLILAVALSRWVGSILERRIIKRAYIDPALGYTIGLLVKYLLVTVGFLLFLNIAFSINLTSIAVVFTALSVGIGFGLQYIAADIASGFILLFERPIRVGDRITIDEDEGDVQSINLRTTIVTTNNRVSIIIPNSRLVSQRVINWSYGDPRVRIAIPVGVGYKSDIELVTNTLLEAAEGVRNVLDEPPPKVQFLEFGAYALHFRLLIWTSQPSRHPQTKSDINYRIAQLFRERNIDIPYPIQELRVRPTEVDAGVSPLAPTPDPNRQPN